MARYRKIDPRIWKDEKFRGLSLEEKLIAFYALTAQSNRIGLFNFSPAMAAEDLETLPETFQKGFEKVCRTLFWRFDKASRVLYIPRWFKYNCPENPNVLLHCLQDLHELPETPLLGDFATNLADLPETFHETFRKGLGQPSPNQEQEQEQEQKQDPATPNARPKTRAREDLPPPPDVLPVHGQLDADLQRAIRAMQAKCFHRLAQPTGLNEAWWNTQLDKVEREGLTIFACLIDVDGFYLGKVKPQDWPTNMEQARDRMSAAIDTAITKLLRQRKKVQHG